MVSLSEALYLASGVILPLYYAPQIRACVRDDTRLEAYSLRKAANQLALRVAGMPFLVGTIGNHFLTFVVCLDVAGRSCEVGAALYSLRRQGVSWSDITRRLSHRTIARSAKAVLGEVVALKRILSGEGSMAGVAVHERIEPVLAAEASRTVHDSRHDEPFLTPATRPGSASQWAELADTLSPRARGEHQ